MTDLSTLVSRCMYRDWRLLVNDGSWGRIIPVFLGVNEVIERFLKISRAPQKKSLNSIINEANKALFVNIT